VEHALGEAFDIAKEAQPASPPKVEVVGQEALATEKEAQPEANLPKVVVAGSRSANGGAGCVQDHILRAWPASCVFG
jgi:hypothetical protein